MKVDNDGSIAIEIGASSKTAVESIEKLSSALKNLKSRRPSGLRKTKLVCNSLAHRTTWLRSDLITTEVLQSK